LRAGRRRGKLRTIGCWKAKSSRTPPSSAVIGAQIDAYCIFTTIAGRPCGLARFLQHLLRVATGGSGARSPYFSRAEIDLPS
jgi:hypothetical protein